MKRLLLLLSVLALAGAGAFLLLRQRLQPEGPSRLRAERGSVVKKAVATGQVEPVHESTVNTHLSGFVRKLHAALGQRVEAGAPLCEVWPSLTERDLLAAERSLQSAIEGEQTAAEFKQGEHVLAYLTRFLQGERNLERMQNAAQRSRKSAEESLQLLREGKVEIDGRTIDFVVRAPVAGHVLQLLREGDPVTPASSYGPGTVVAMLGDLDQPVFRGTVDEIDVGRMKNGMTARVTLGALPGLELAGTVQEIGLRARRVDNAATFDVRIALQAGKDLVLRSGYSAVAEVELCRAEGVVVLPERAIQYQDGKPFVWRADGHGGFARTAVELGLSDGLSVEVRGLEAGAEVSERAPVR
jgi:HlyD family secretion protein